MCPHCVLQLTNQRKMQPRDATHLALCDKTHIIMQYPSQCKIPPLPSCMYVHTDTLVVIAHPRQPARKSLHASPQQIIRTLELDKALVSILALAQTHTLASLGVLIAV